MRKKLSIITINLNNSAGLNKTMKSVLGQLFRDYEYIIIDGGSTDGSVEVIKSFERLYSKIKDIIWLSETDKGIYNAMNKGINLAHGEYLLFLNSGDSLVNPDIIKTVFSTNFSEEYVYGNINLYRNNDICYNDVKMIFDVPTLFDLYNDCLPHQASFIKRELFEKYGKYDESLKIIGDWDFCIRSIIVNNCSVRHIQFTISNYDLTGISTTNREQNEIEKTLILNKYFPPRLIKDLERLSAYKNDFKLIDWYNSRPLYKSIMKFIFKVGYKVKTIF